MKTEFLYENLILNALECRQYNFLGADFKVYLNMIESESLYLAAMQDKANGQETLNTLAFEYGINVGVVSSNIREAIAHMLSKHEAKLNDVQIELLEVYLDELNKPSRKKIDEIIDLTNQILVQIGLNVYSQVNT
jgi:hypothetical protein